MLLKSMTQNKEINFFLLQKKQLFYWDILSYSLMEYSRCETESNDFAKSKSQENR